MDVDAIESHVTAGGEKKGLPSKAEAVRGKRGVGIQKRSGEDGILRNPLRRREAVRKSAEARSHQSLLDPRHNAGSLSAGGPKSLDTPRRRGRAVGGRVSSL